MDGCGVRGQDEMRSVVRSGSRKNECVPRARGGRGKGAGGPSRGTKCADAAGSARRGGAQ